MMQHTAQHMEEKAALIKMGAGVSGAIIYGFTLNQWVAIVTIAYVLLQIGLLLPRYWRFFANVGKRIRALTKR